ncbi:proepiregulin-like isoform 1-T1 [Synchiropus picturatus]
MWKSKLSALYSVLGVMLLWPDILAKTVVLKLQHADVETPPAEHREERPPMVRRSAQSCDSTFDHYCLNNGQCMLLVDINEHHCKCDSGFYGPRCSHPELSVKPMEEKQLIMVIFCVALLLLGTAGLIYFCWKWCKKNKFPRQCQGDKGVQSA